MERRSAPSPFVANELKLTDRCRTVPDPCRNIHHRLLAHDGVAVRGEPSVPGLSLTRRLLRFRYRVVVRFRNLYPSV